MTIGEQLNEARTKLGIDLRSANEATKIRMEYLDALEKDDIKRIDLADVYCVGFVRIYSKYLKLDADKIVAEFKAANNISNSHIVASRNPVPFALNGDKPNVHPRAKKNRFILSYLNKKQLAILCGCAIFVLVLFGLLVHSCSSSNSDIEPTASGFSSQLVAYEFEIVSSIPQKIEIYEDYKGWDKEKGKAIVGVKICEEFVSANRPRSFTGRGTLYIKEGATTCALTISAPDPILFTNVNTGAVVKLNKSVSANVKTYSNRGNSSRGGWLAKIGQ